MAKQPGKRLAAQLLQYKGARARSVEKLHAAFRLPPKAIDEAIAGFARLYEETGDPFHAVHAAWVARRYGRSVPECAVRYLDRVLNGLVAVSQDEPTKLAAAVIKALEMSGRARGVLFAKRRQVRKAEQYAADVLALKRQGHNIENATYLVAKFHKVGRSRVLRAFQLVKGRGRFLGTLSGRSPRPSENLLDQSD